MIISKTVVAVQQDAVQQEYVMSEKAVKPVCPKCGRKSINTRIDGSIRCYKCGYEGDLKGGKKE